MGFVIRLSNLVEKCRSSDCLDDLDADSRVFNSEWKSFVEGELEDSNKTNSKSLGGRPRSSMDDDDEANQFDVNMEKIMSRFNTFNSLMSASSNADDDEEEDMVQEEDDIIQEFNLESVEHNLVRPGTPQMKVEIRVEVGPAKSE